MKSLDVKKINWDIIKLTSIYQSLNPENDKKIEDSLRCFYDMLADSLNDTQSYGLQHFEIDNKHIFVLKIDIGNMGQSQGEKYCNHLTIAFKKSMSSFLEKDIHVVTFPVRSS
jgi:hypothetical protein